ncbi:730eb83d-c379-4cb9-af08-d413e0040caf [Sclerotinia trifoliorum]|uniref:730eb83d-c379-4cb9-af08-d413e0040caf n=1 Tax=Sclerotinia trifoliorum TaxID=28548 RepID=A0A8H2ZU01_9HELO|nr:730eb83d-c379-4cb9-af08-d413e0040caf [Sclerotinia trifoliorum]
MRFTNLALAASAVAGANAAPRPQNIDFQSLSPVVQSAQNVPVGVTAQVVSYNPTAAASIAAAAVTQSSAIKGATSDTKRQFNHLKARDGTCARQPETIYIGTNPTDDPDSFVAYKPFADAANSASTPSGYTRSFVNLHASNNALKYMGFTQLPTYDTASCADKCSAITGCNAFNLYFERDPIVDPGANCTNPSSMTNVKCVFWGGSIDSKTAVNDGQWRSKFRVVIAGSNGYNLASVPTPGGYSPPSCLEDSAINAPLGCNKDDTFLGSRFFTDTPFDVSLCTAACDATSSYDLAHPPATGSSKTCQFINTYILYLNGVAQGQTCAMYTESWDSSYAKNTGYTSGSDVYTIGSSYTLSNSTNPNYAKDCKAPVNSTSSSVLSTSASASSTSGTVTPKILSSTSASDSLPSSTANGTSVHASSTPSISTSGIVSGTSASQVLPSNTADITSVHASSTLYASTSKTISSISESHTLASNTDNTAISSTVSSNTRNSTSAFAPSTTSTSTFHTLSTTSASGALASNTANSTSESSRSASNTVGSTYVSHASPSNTKSSYRVPQGTGYASASGPTYSGSPTSSVSNALPSYAASISASNTLPSNPGSNTFFTSVTSSGYLAASSSAAATESVSASSNTPSISNSRSAGSYASETLSGSIPSCTFSGSSDPVTSSNLGINFAYFSNPTLTTGYGSSQFDVNSLNGKIPTYTGTASQIGFSNTAAGSDVTLYPGAPSCSVEQLAIVHTGYVYARKAGTYTFDITAFDDIVMGWIGSNAFGSYSSSNADLSAASSDTHNAVTTVSKTLAAGQLVPFKVLWANGASSGSLGFTIKGPDSILLSSSSGSAKDVITTPSSVQTFSFPSVASIPTNATPGLTSSH